MLGDTRMYYGVSAEVERSEVISRAERNVPVPRHGEGSEVGDLSGFGDVYTCHGAGRFNQDVDVMARVPCV
jgi:hypothetical protein